MSPGRGEMRDLRMQFTPAIRLHRHSSWSPEFFDT